MSNQLEDLWPASLAVADELQPRDLLNYQAVTLERRTAGLLRGSVRELTAEDRTELSFWIIAPLLDYSASLFSVRHRKDIPYPAVIIPPDPLPDFLQPTVVRKKVVKPYRPPTGIGSAKQLIQTLAGQEEVSETIVEPNQWFVSTDAELRAKLRDVLDLPQTISLVKSLVARSRQSQTQTVSPLASAAEPSLESQDPE